MYFQWSWFLSKIHNDENHGSLIWVPKLQTVLLAREKHTASSSVILSWRKALFWKGKYALSKNSSSVETAFFLSQVQIAAAIIHTSILNLKAAIDPPIHWFIDNQQRQALIEPCYSFDARTSNNICQKSQHTIYQTCDPCSEQFTNLWSLTNCILCRLCLDGFWTSDTEKAWISIESCSNCFTTGKTLEKDCQKMQLNHVIDKSARVAHRYCSQVIDVEYPGHTVSVHSLDSRFLS